MVLCDVARGAAGGKGRHRCILQYSANACLCCYEVPEHEQRSYKQSHTLRRVVDESNVCSAAAQFFGDGGARAVGERLQQTIRLRCCEAHTSARAGVTLRSFSQNASGLDSHMFW